MSQEVFDFNGVKAPETKGFLKPGIYDLRISNTSFESPEGKTPYIEVTFTGDSGQMKQKFFITPKAMNRLVYLHEGLFAQPITKAFPNAEAVGAYFTKLLNTKQPTKRVLVGGQEGTDGRVYASLGYSDFIVDEATPTQVFEEGSSQWTSNVKRSENRAMVKDNDNAILPGSTTSNSASNNDDLPF